jgi:hypothetical protein
MPLLGDIVPHTLFKPEAERIPAVVANARARAAAVLNLLEQALGGTQRMSRLPTMRTARA